MRVCGRDPAIFMSNGFKLAHSPHDELAGKEQGRRKVQFVRHKLSPIENEKGPTETSGSLLRRCSSKMSYRSIVQQRVFPMMVSSVVFWDKSLCISLTAPQRKPPRYKSRLSIRFGVSPGSVGYTSVGDDKSNGCDRDPTTKRVGHLEAQKALTGGFGIKADDSDRRGLGSPGGVLSFRGATTSRPKAASEKRDADESVLSSLCNFRPGQDSFKTHPEQQTWSRQARREETDGERGEVGCSSGPPTLSSQDETGHYFPPLTNDSTEGIPETMSLKEALQLFKPDFISRSQTRLRRLEQRAKRRRVGQMYRTDSARDLWEDPAAQKRKCTTPDPLSDNLFKPSERSISGREMQLRSRRIYNKLPEVAKKKEEERRRAESQANRLRAEVFKKKVLDQILQR